MDVMGRSRSDQDELRRDDGPPWHVALLVALTGVGLFAVVSVVMLVFATDGCVTGTCRAHVAWTIGATTVVMVATYVAACVATLATRRAGRHGIIPPCVGIALVIIEVVAAQAMVQAAPA